MSVEGKVVIVTGGGSGIGLASCLAFAEAGAKVVVANRTGSKAESVAHEIATNGGESLPLEIDVAKSDDIERMVRQTVQHYGRVDVLYNNAGISPEGRITDITEADWDECMDIDLKAVFLASKHAIPHMVEQGGGVILSTAGTFGIRPVTGKFAYSVAKAGVINLTRSIALDYARDNVRANAICPGFVQTPLTAGVDEAVRDKALDIMQPLPGIMQPEEIAAMAVYLASDAARMITGQCVVMDGGQQAGLFLQ